MASQFVDEIDAAVLRLIERRRSIVRQIGDDLGALDGLGAIQGAFADLRLARDHEMALQHVAPSTKAKGKAVQTK